MFVAAAFCKSVKHFKDIPPLLIVFMAEEFEEVLSCLDTATR